jgi:hypothetical protein
MTAGITDGKLPERQKKINATGVDDYQLFVGVNGRRSKKNFVGESIFPFNFTVLNHLRGVKNAWEARREFIG